MGKITSQSPGTTTIIATIKYQIKSTKKAKQNKAIKKKKIKIPITVKSEYLVDIPQTGMQYDETGKAMPIYPYTWQTGDEGAYSNEASYIDRFPVWVETDYDTDQDGKRDLIMAYVQVPKSATQGYYKAPVIFEANPYFTNGARSGSETEKLLKKTDKDAFDYSLLTNSPGARVPESEISTSEVVSGASAWVNDVVNNEYGSMYFAGNNYYVIRGYACVISPGLGGSKECEGLQCCGERVEAESYAAIVEWLHGDRNGYADKEGTKLVRADWCNGHTAMTGHSYLGSLAYEVATLGVQGLDTVIPSGAISSWYNYCYSQGSMVSGISNYMAWLGDFCAKRYYYNSKKEEKSDPFFKIYKNYLFKKNYDEVMADGRYGEFWSRMEFSKAKPTVPALLIEGLNDENVKSNQTVLMRKAFVDAGQECKVIYHQGCHDTLIYPNVSKTGVLKVGDEYYSDLQNRWLAHYMAGIDNGIDQMKDYTVQSNVDGSWTTYDAGRETEIMEMRPKSDEKETTVKFDAYKLLKKVNDKTDTETAQMKIKDAHTVWEQDIDKDITLSGMVAVHFRAKMPDVNKNAPTVYMKLLDTNDKKFNVFYNDPGVEGSYAAFESTEAIDAGDGIGEYNRMEFSMKPDKEKKITSGTIDLRMPDAGWEAETCTESKNPTKNNKYYDYTVYMMPKDYTVKAGHKLKLCIMGLGEDTMQIDSFKIVDSYTAPLGFAVIKAGEYKFTIDNKSSYAELPIVKES